VLIPLILILLVFIFLIFIFLILLLLFLLFKLFLYKFKIFFGLGIIGERVNQALVILYCLFQMVLTITGIGKVIQGIVFKFPVLCIYSLGKIGFSQVIFTGCIGRSTDIIIKTRVVRIFKLGVNKMLFCLLELLVVPGLHALLYRRSPKTCPGNSRCHKAQGNGQANQRTPTFNTVLAARSLGKTSFGNQQQYTGKQGPLKAFFPDFFATLGQLLLFHGVQDIPGIDLFKVHVPSHGSYIAALGHGSNFFKHGLVHF